MRYQAHVDGLRAVAILPVIIFHLGSGLFPGGYVGVDVFFVISGFLITRILVEDIFSNRYSIIEFYKRRILRIVPALAVVLIATFFLSNILFFEADRKETGKSIIAAAAFLSNFYFWINTEYFTVAAERQPLLHIWSLAVEEQFYIFFPPLLFLLIRLTRKYLLHAIVALSVASLIACIFLTIQHQPTAFYLLPPRAWELGVGAGLAVWARQRPLSENGNLLLSVSGAVLVLLPMLLLDSASVFPGWNAVAPVVGAMLLIGWGNSGIVGSALSSKPFIAVGKVSYSLYLWHWPVIVFWKAYAGDDLSGLEMLGLGVLSLALGALSTHVIERPFRSQRSRQIPAVRVVSAGGATIVALIAVGGVAMKGLVTLRTFPENVRQIAATADYRTWPDYMAQFRTGRCLIGQEDGSSAAFDIEACTRVDPDGYNVLVVGDSHAAQFWGPLAEAFPDANVMQATSSGCRALVGAGGAQRCIDLRKWIFEDFLPANDIDLVILGGRWRKHEMSFVSGTLAELKRLAENVVVIGPTSEYEGTFPLLLARSELAGEEFNFPAYLVQEREMVNELMRAEVEAVHLTYIDILGTECRDGTCMLFAPDGVPMKFDYGHLTFSGARFIIEANKDKFSERRQSAPSEGGQLPF